MPGTRKCRYHGRAPGNVALDQTWKGERSDRKAQRENVRYWVYDVKCSPTYQGQQERRPRCIKVAFANDSSKPSPDELELPGCDESCQDTLRRMMNPDATISNAPAILIPRCLSEKSFPPPSDAYRIEVRLTARTRATGAYFTASSWVKRYPIVRTAMASKNGHCSRPF